jgi:hypothetical protein
MLKELGTRSPDVGGFPHLHRSRDGLRDGRQDIAIRQVERLRPVAPVESSPVAVSRWSIGEQTVLPQSVLEDFNQIYDKALLRFGQGNIDFKW